MPMQLGSPGRLRRSDFLDLGKGDDNLHLGGAHDFPRSGGISFNQATFLGGDGKDRVFNDGQSKVNTDYFSGFETFAYIYMPQSKTGKVSTNVGNVNAKA